MFGSKILEVAISLTFVYLLLSLICSAIKEAIAALFNMRANALKRAITRLIDEQHAEEFFSHPLIKSLAKNGKKPAYIEAATFATTLLEVLAPKRCPPSAAAAASPNGVATLVNLQTAIDANANIAASTKKTVLALLDAADNNMAQARKNLENWFNEAMERASGLYKRWAQIIIAVPAVVITVWLNVDTITIVKRLYRDDALRAIAVSAAQQAVTNQPAATSASTRTNQLDALESACSWITQAQKKDRELQDLDLPIGWTTNAVHEPFCAMDCHKRGETVFGWMITILAVSLGATFWFDLLGKLVNLRLSGEPPKIHKAKAS